MDTATGSGHTTSSDRIPGLDGLRAVAVSGVLLFHAGVAAVPGGFLGVDLFFVLSGFLITTLLLRELTRRGSVDVVAFWARRARRLLPGLFVVTLATIVVFGSVAGSVERGELRGDAVAAVLYVANWHFVRTTEGYFEQLEAPSPLLHTWSLSIEEQFYVVWPLLVLLALVLRMPRWVLTSTVVTGAVASAGWMAYLHLREVDADRLYYGTDTRAHTILLGVVAALVLSRRVQSSRRVSRRGQWTSAAVAGGALACVVAVLCRVDASDSRLQRGGLLLFAAVCAALIGAVATTSSGWVTRFLELAPLRAVGVLSYSLYLWHWPVFLFLTAGRTSLSGLSLLGARLATTVVLSVICYRFVERPLRHAAWRPRRLVVLPVGALASGVALVVAVSSVLPGAAPPPRRIEAASALPVDASDRAADGLERPARTLLSRPAVAPARENTPPGLQVTVLGDSVAYSLAKGLVDRRGRTGVRWNRKAVLGCGILPPSDYRYVGVLNLWTKKHCRGLARKWRKKVASRPADVVAVLVGRWEVVDQVYDGRWTSVGDPAFDDFVRARLRIAIDAASSTGAPVALLSAPYCYRGEQPDGGGWPEDDPRRVDAFNRILREVADERPGVRVIDLGRKTSGGSNSYVERLGDIRLRHDGVHFTIAAARWLQPWLEKRLLRVATGPRPPQPTQPANQTASGTHHWHADSSDEAPGRRN
jgi:peptidoglycan/LPS O-acetylase OafA/YrhL